MATFISVIFRTVAGCARGGTIGFSFVLAAVLFTAPDPALAFHNFDCGGHNQSACDIGVQIWHGRSGCDAGLAEIFIPACGVNGAPACKGIATTWCSQRREIGETCGLGVGMGVPCKSGLTCELIKFASDGVFAESRCYAKIEDGDGPEACLATFSRSVLNQAIAGTFTEPLLNDGGEGKTMNFGYGGTAAIGAFASGERGVLYTRDGCYGCYVSNCTGVTATVGFTFEVTEGESKEHMICPGEGKFCSNAPARGCAADSDCAAGGSCLPCYQAGGTSFDTTTELGLTPLFSVSETTSLSNCDYLTFLDGPGPGECIYTGHSESFSAGIAIGFPVNAGFADCNTTVVPAGCLVPDGNDEIGPGSDFDTDLNQKPTCSAVATPTACTGSTTTVLLNGSGSSDPEGKSLTYAWSSTCAGATFSSVSAVSPSLGIDSTAFTAYPGGGAVECTATLNLTDADGGKSQCSTGVVVYDNISPSISAPADIAQQHTEPLPNAVALGLPVVSDACDTNPTVTNNAPAAFPLGPTNVIWTVTDDVGLISTDTQTVQLLNSAPHSLAPGSLTVPEDGSKSFTLTAGDVNGDTIVFAVASGPGKGSLTGTAPNLTYTPAANYYGPDSFTFTATDIHGAGSSLVVSITVLPVNDPPQISVNRASASVQYSDTIGMVTITASDPDDTSLSLSSSFTDSTPAPLGSDLPSGLSTSGGCVAVPNPAPAAPGSSCSWTLSGPMLENAGDYLITLKATDGGGGTGSAANATANTGISVAAEQATVVIDSNNPTAIEVDGDGSDASLPFTLVAYVAETEPDLATYSAVPGDLSLAGPVMVLNPVGPGSPVSPTSCSEPVVGAGYDQLMTFTCEFSGVPVNTYSVDVALAGTYYQGAADDVFTVYDPSLGFTTGGGWFPWPGTGEKTNFGYTMKYGRKGSSPKGSLLLIRHLADGTKYRVKSNALEGLALGEDASIPMGWATFSGKATYLAPGMSDPEGNHAFTLYVEDRDEPGTGIDRVWLETRDKDGEPIPAMSLDEPAPDNAVSLGGGNIVVPHQGL